MSISTAVKVTFWSQGGKDRQDAALTQAQKKPAELSFEADGRFYAGRLQIPVAGSLVLSFTSPRPFRLWIGGAPVVDEGLCWRFYEREIHGAAIVPCVAGELSFLVEVGPRSTWSEGIDRDCPSRNREKVRAALKARLPDRLNLCGRVEAAVEAPAVSLRFMPAQFRHDGVAWQQIEARPVNGFSRRPPSLKYWASFEEPEAPLFLASSVLPRQAREGTTPEEKQRGLRRFYVPVSNSLDEAPALRQVGTPDRRVEPALEVARELILTVEGDAGKVTLPFPAFEGLGRKAPQREFRQLDWPSFAEARARLPEPVLPESHAWLSTLYWAAWEMLFGLMRQPKPESGLPNGYIGTASRNFLVYQFVWDSSFTAMCTAYGWRGLHAYATLDVLYSRQFDGGYIHREHDLRDGMPTAYEPDFSPNPPIMSVAEWAIAGLTGDQLRLAKVYPALKDMHKWLEANRRLPDGTYWTTGLANGLDNSPSLGDGYPCLTAQMAHEAEILGKMAHVLGLDTEAAAWEAEHDAIAKALNERLWCDTQQIYATSLAGGGHNPNKVVTAFWPLWAGLVPAERIASLAVHFKDPHSFWRHHPLPSLAADSPCFKPGGDYWLGSTWAPTNFAAIKGIDRAGRHDIAVEAALRHLKCMTEVYHDTGHIWENYCSEKSARGSWSGPDYCWSALGPIAMLMEIVIGLQGDALNNRLCWNLPLEPGFGVKNLALGAATISLRSEQDAAGKFWVDVTTDRSFTLEITAADKVIRQECRAGHTRAEVA